MGTQCAKCMPRNKCSFPSFVPPHLPAACQSQVPNDPPLVIPDPFFHIHEFVSDFFSICNSAALRMHNASTTPFFPVALLLWIAFQHPVVCSHLFEYSHAHTTSLSEVSQVPSSVTPYNMEPSFNISARKKLVSPQF